MGALSGFIWIYLWWYYFFLGGSGVHFDAKKALVYIFGVKKAL